ncbi:autotransporter domain-containing protein [Bordetella bronchiseptica]|uniref:autotransporter family protein n=2 Tax=Bordetella bronchiseptica TaxID=518 RepID=UPI000FDA4F28|nr:autotransporter domain-containing protein [Bordetella bronchiseptica]
MRTSTPFSLKNLPLALMLAGLVVTVPLAHAQRIESGGGKGGGADGGLGGLAAGGGGQGGGNGSAAGGAGGAGSLDPALASRPGANGPAGSAGLGGAGGVSGDQWGLTAGGGGGGGGAGSNTLADDGGSGGIGGIGNIMAAPTVSLSSTDLNGGSGQDGSSSAQHAAGAGGGGGGGAGLMLLYGGTASVEIANTDIAGGAGGKGWSSPGSAYGDDRTGAGGGGGVGLFMAGAGTLALRATDSNLYSIIGGAGGVGDQGSSIGGNGGAAIFLYDGAALSISNQYYAIGGGGGDVNILAPASKGGDGASAILANAATIGNSGMIQGGAGGLGHTAGAGGNGIVAYGGTIYNYGVIVGGVGGQSSSGTSGQGGAAIVLLASPTPTTVVNYSGYISGGIPHTSNPGIGGAGIVSHAHNTTIRNFGYLASIRGGQGTPGGPYANAVELYGNDSVVETDAQAQFFGNVVSLGSNNLLRFQTTDSLALDASTIGPAGTFRGFAALEKAGPGALALTGTPGAVLPWSLTGGYLAVASDASLGGAPLRFDGGALRVQGAAFASTASSITWGPNGGGFDIEDPANTFTVSQDLAGGALYKSGPGTLVLTGANSFTYTAVNDGTLIGNASSISGDIFNAALLVFDQPTTGTVAGNIVGTGRYVKRNTGTLNLAQGLGNAQEWRIEGGTLRTTNADHRASNAKLAGNGVFAKAGAGILRLTGDSSAFAGHTQVEAGTLTVGAGGAGKLGGSLSISSGAMLEGTGVAGATTLLSGAVIAPGVSTGAPGVSVGTLTVDGNLAFAPGAVYRVEADPDSSASDRIVVTGTAALAGSAVHIGPDTGANAGFASARDYTILSANLVTGQFDTIKSNYAFLAPRLRYTTQDVTLRLERKQVPVDPSVDPSVDPATPPTRPIRFADAARSGNQAAVARALDSLPAASALHEYILTLPQGAPPAAFDSLSGEAHASVTASLASLGASVPTLPLAHLRANLAAGLRPGAPTAQATGPLPASALPASAAQPAWAEVFGNWQTLDGNGNAARVKQHTGGVFVGADHELGAGWRAGAALGVADSKIRVDDRASQADVNSYSAVLYGGKAFQAGAGKLNLLAGAAYTWHDIDTERYASVAGASQKLSAGYGASTAQVFGELGYALAVSEAATVEPYAGIAYSDLRTRGFSESGGSAALSGQSDSNSLTTTTLGLRAHTRFTLGQAEATLRANLGWRHAFGDVQPASTLAFAGGQAFTVAGTPIARNAALLGLGADVAVSRSLTLGLAYDGQYGDGNREHTGMLRMRWAF